MTYTAFQPNAFQPNAFQIGPLQLAVAVGTGAPDARPSNTTYQDASSEWTGFDTRSGNGGGPGASGTITGGPDARRNHGGGPGTE